MGVDHGAYIVYGWKIGEKLNVDEILLPTIIEKYTRQLLEGYSTIILGEAVDDRFNGRIKAENRDAYSVADYYNIICSTIYHTYYTMEIDENEIMTKINNAKIDIDWFLNQDLSDFFTQKAIDYFTSTKPTLILFGAVE